MRFAAETSVGKVRRINEDAYHAADNLLVVADGMGGHAAGEVASGLAVTFLSGWTDWLDPLAALSASMRAANERIVQAALTHPGQAGMGTTLTATYLRGRFAFIGHVGDSRLYLHRQGVLRQLTRDHSVVGELMRIGGLTEREARLHPQRNIVTRALGANAELDVDTSVAEVAAGDRLVLCTDGLHGVLFDDEISRTVARYTDPAAATTRLVEMANARGGPDNITVVIAALAEEDVR